MDAPVQDAMIDYMPGVKLEGKPRIQCKSILMMYVGVHIPKREYEDWMKDQLFDNFSAEVESITISHRSGTDHRGTHKYTYVIICTVKAIRTQNIRLFYWKSVRPEIRTLKNAAQVSYAAEYLLNWKYYPVPEPEVAAPPSEQHTTVPIKLEVQPGYAEVMYTSDRPLVFYISNFLGWQTQVVLKINELCDPNYREKYSEAMLRYINPENKELPYPQLREQMGRSNKMIHVVRCAETCGPGITTFFKALKYPIINPTGIPHPKIVDHNPDRYLIIVGMPNHLNFLKEADLQREKGWNGECVIFDVTGEKALGEEIRRTLEEASDEPTCKTVWVFTKVLPNPAMFSSYRWKFYKIGAYWIMGNISDLDNLEWNYAVDAYSKQRK